MAGNDSFAYCDSDEEVFFGKVTEKELLKRALLGYNSDTPNGKSTPRAKSLNKSTNLPDVLNGSRNEIVGSPTSSHELENGEQRACPSLNSSFNDDEDIIDLGSINNSVQVISDDESFLLNEKIVYGNCSDIDLATKNDVLNKGLENISGSSIKENNELDKIATKLMIDTDCITEENADVNDSNVYFGEENISGVENLNVSFTQKNNELDEDVAQLETNSNSLNRNSDLSGSDIHFGMEDVGLNKGLENLCVSATKENSKFENAVAELETNTTIRKGEVDFNLSCTNYPDDEKSTQLKNNSNEASLKDTNTIVIDDIQNKCHSEETIGCITNDNILLTESFQQKSPRKLSVTSTVYSDNEYPSESLVDIREDSKITELNIPVPIAHDFTGNFSHKSKVSEIQTLQGNCLHKKDLSSTLNDTDYISINGISDSILNISHDSSIFSPALPGANKKSGNNLLANVIYEDISFDGEQTLERDNQSTSVLPKSYIQIDDLHMSVDEPDYQENFTISDSVETGSSHHSLFASCFDKSSVSSYHTANADSENHISKRSSDSFNKYRETLDDTVDLETIEAGSSVDIDNEGKNETSFEIIVQNRQNSFISSPSPSNVKVTNETEQIKPTLVSKLPLFNYNSKSLIQPPKLNVTSASLKYNSYKWAKNFQELDSKKATLNKKGSEVSKDVNCKILTPSKAVTIQKCQRQNVIAPSTKMGLASSNISCTKKTPAKSISNQASTLVKSQSKSSPMNSPRYTKTLSTEKKIKSKLIPPTSLGKNRYKNIVSPVQAYISGSPTILQERKCVSEEIKVVISSENKISNSHLPMKIKTEGTNVVKKLNYEKMQGQENRNPNYSRDTLPPRMLQSSEAVFMKEPEPPKKYLPKMGQKVQKLLDTPRPKLVVHQGRVRNSPNAKGVLLPCANVKSPEHSLELPAERVSIRMVKTVDNTNELK